MTSILSRTGGQSKAAPSIDQSLQTRLIRKTTGDLMLYFPTILIRGTIGLISAAILSKLFAPEDYGNYTIAFTAYSQLTLVTGLWITYAIMRLTPEYKKKGQYSAFAVTLLKTEFLILTSVTAAGVMVLWLMRPTIEPQLYKLFFVAVLAGFFLPLVTAIEEYCRISDRVSTYCVIVLVRIFSGLVCGLILALSLKLGVLGYFIGLALPNACIVVFVAFRARVKCLQLLRHHSFSWAILKGALVFSLPLVMVSAMTTILGFSDRYLIRWYLSAYEVGIYGIAYIIASQAMELITLVLVTTAEPIVMRNWEENGERASTRYLSDILRYYTMVAIPALTGLIILGGQFITFISTPAYVVGLPILMYVSFGVMLNGYCQLLSRVFALRKKTIPPLVIYTTAALINIVLNILLLPIYGYLAAAWTTAASYVILLVLTLLTVRRMVQIEFWAAYQLKILLASVLMGLLVHACSELSSSVLINLIVAVVIGAGFYSILLYLFGVVNKQEVQMLFDGIKRKE